MRERERGSRCERPDSNQATPLASKAAAASATYDKAVVVHVEDKVLAHDGEADEGNVSTGGGWGGEGGKGESQRKGRRGKGNEERVSADVETEHRDFSFWTAARLAREVRETRGVYCERDMWGREGDGEGEGEAATGKRKREGEKKRRKGRETFFFFFLFLPSRSPLPFSLSPFHPWRARSRGHRRLPAEADAQQQDLRGLGHGGGWSPSGRRPAGRETAARDA